MANTLHSALILSIICFASASLNLFQESYLFNELSTIPTDNNFTVSTFVGDWNVVALYGIGISNRTCPTVNVKKTITTSLTLTLSFIDLITDEYDTMSRTFQPNPLNKAILIDVLDPVNDQSLAVSYYNDTIGLALLINMNGTYAAALSKSPNVYANGFLETMNDIFVEAGIPVNETELFNHYGCTTNYTSADNINVSALSDTFYGNMLYTNISSLKNLECLNVGIQVEDNVAIYNITQYLTYNGLTFTTSGNYITSPVDDAFLINIDNDITPSFVVNFYDHTNDLFLLVAHDGSFAFAVSRQETLGEAAIIFVKNALKADGFQVTDDNLVIFNKTCNVTSNIVQDFGDFNDILSIF